MDHKVDHIEQHPLSKFSKEPLFLNVDDPSREWTFVSASDILINAPEGGGFTPTREFLRPYEGLLLQVGARRLEKAASSSASNSEHDVDGMLMKFNEMRRQNHLTDVVLVDNEGREHGAHRLVLVCHSDHLEAMFLGENEMIEGRPDAHAGDPVKVDLSEMYSGACIESALGSSFSSSYYGIALIESIHRLFLHQPTLRRSPRPSDIGRLARLVQLLERTTSPKTDGASTDKPYFPLDR